jgi:hypothetical protein
MTEVLSQKEACGAKAPRSPFVLSLFLFLTCLSVCLRVSRACAYLTNNQQYAYVYIGTICGK